MPRASADGAPNPVLKRARPIRKDQSEQWRSNLRGIGQVKQLYYRQKGIRPVTRPDVIKDNFEDCAEELVKRCQSYKTQCEDYHNECLQEFRQQLSCLEALAGRVPCFVLNDLEQKSLKKLQTLLNEEEQEHDKIAEDIDREMRLHEQELRPYLGHPQNQDKLEDLLRREEERWQMALSHVEQHTTKLNKIVHEQSEAFLEDLARKSENLLVQFDNMLVVDEIQTGRQPDVKFTSAELIRRQKEGQSLYGYSKAELDEIVRGKNTWPGLSKDLPGLTHITHQETKKQSSSSSITDDKSKVADESANLRTASITTMKTTLGHNATMKARDAAYEEFKAYTASALATIEEDSNTRKRAEERLFEKWRTAVEKVKNLYD